MSDGAPARVRTRDVQMLAYYNPIRPGEPRKHADYTIRIPELGVHFYVAADLFEEYFTVEGPENAG